MESGGSGVRARLEAGADGEGDGRAGGEQERGKGASNKQPDDKREGESRLAFPWFPRLAPCFPNLPDLPDESFGLLWLSSEAPTTSNQAKEKSCKAAS